MADEHLGTWLLESATSRVPVAGTQSYQPVVWGIVGPPAGARGGRARWHGIVLLESEPDNPHDANAVRVAAGGETAGYLPRDLAARLQPALRALERRGLTVAVPAYATGGFVLPDGSRASVGLRLRFEPQDLLDAAAELAGTAAERRPVAA